MEKNKRKCDHLKQEIDIIKVNFFFNKKKFKKFQISNLKKKLKFNEVAIFTFENENVTFEQYIKANNVTQIIHFFLTQQLNL